MKLTDKYTTELSQGTGLINETLSLLPHYKQGMSVKEMEKYVIDNGILPSCTPTRIYHIVDKVFFNRFVKPNPQIPSWLLSVRKKGLMLDEFSQIAMIYCARVHRVYYDFIIEVLNPLRLQQVRKFQRDEADRFMVEIVKRGDAKWSETMQHKNATYLRNTLSAFGQSNAKCEVLPYKVNDFTVLYLLHELHFSGVSDNGIINDSDWQVLGMSKVDVISRIMDLSLKGGYIAQYSGEFMTISWNHKSMEEFIDATL